MGIFARVRDQILRLPSHALAAHSHRKVLPEQGENLVGSGLVIADRRFNAASSFLRPSFDPRNGFCCCRSYLLPFDCQQHFTSYCSLHALGLCILGRVLLSRPVVPTLDIRHVGRHARFSHRHGTRRRFAQTYCSQQSLFRGCSRNRLAFCCHHGRSRRSRAVVCARHQGDRPGGTIGGMGGQSSSEALSRFDLRRIGAGLSPNGTKLARSSH